MTWIKICGTTNRDDALASVVAGADALGFIFAPSPRAIRDDVAAAIITALPPAVETIGVFVNEPPLRVAAMAARVNLTGVQLHGDEPAAALAQYRAALGGRKIIKTLQARQLLSSKGKLDGYLKVSYELDAILLDAGSAEQRGGTGVPFPWQEAAAIAAEIRQAVPLIVAGGLTPENVGEAIRLLVPAGVDVVSAVEATVGKKDAAKLRSFIDSVRKAGEMRTAAPSL